MTSKADFTDEEWTRLKRAPFVAGMAISLADPGGPIEATKETAATLKIATNPPTREQLLTEVALDVQSMVQQHHNPLKGFKPTSDRPVGDQVVDELHLVSEMVRAKADAAESAAFGEWIIQVAQAAAEAAKEGGFLGIGAELVSARESEMLDRVRTAVTST